MTETCGAWPPSARWSGRGPPPRRTRCMRGRCPGCGWPSVPSARWSTTGGRMDATFGPPRSVVCESERRGAFAVGPVERGLRAGPSDDVRPVPHALAAAGDAAELHVDRHRLRRLVVLERRQIGQSRNGDLRDAERRRPFDGARVRGSDLGGAGIHAARRGAARLTTKRPHGDTPHETPTPVHRGERIPYPRGMRRFLVAAAAFAWVGTAEAFPGPDSTAVLASADVTESSALADAYAAFRDVPTRQVCKISGMPQTDDVSLSDYQTLILAPFEACSSRRRAFTIASRRCW